MKYPLVCLQRKTSIKNAIQQIERSPFDRAFVVDEAGVYAGCVAVADLRRLLISGAQVEEPVDAYPMRHDYSLADKSLETPRQARALISDMKLKGVRFLPVVDPDGRITEILSLEDISNMYSVEETEATAKLPAARKVLVVGGAGFLGSVLTRKLLARGFRVRVLDSFIYDRKSLDNLAGDENLEIVEGDLRNIHTCVSALADIDAVVLLAAIVGDPASKVRPTQTIETNVLAAQALAMASKLHFIPRFLYASTCSVYGIGDAILDEDAPLNPVSLYARTKIESEKIILGMGDEYFCPTVLRMGTLYGFSPRMRFDLVVNTMSMKSHVNGGIQVFGGDQWRPLLGVEDAAEVYVRCLEAKLEDVGNQVFNVGSDAQNYKIDEVAQIISEALGGVPISRDQSNLDSRDYRVSFAKLSDILKYAPVQTIDGAAREIVKNLQSGVIKDPARKIYYNHFFDSAEE
ncbi:MAG: NAD-dependent epimerase/dehydratase family protein [Acidobacteriota bacterium]|jgi:nucleoside-diphosphate-sugar epimerase/CBS domain-containing protein|nr:NAD-dependent epimerase/dehydratase family protein [Acidobacteriota bacterium]